MDNIAPRFAAKQTVTASLGHMSHGTLITCSPMTCSLLARLIVFFSFASARISSFPLSFFCHFLHATRRSPVLGGG
jgi:hypothetical protein